MPRKNLNKSLYISSKHQSLIPKTNQIFQIHRQSHKKLQLPERILEEIDSDESISKSPSSSSAEELLEQECGEQADDKLSRKKFDFLYKRTCFRLMVDFFKSLFQTMFKGKKVSRNYARYMQ